MNELKKGNRMKKFWKLLALMATFVLLPSAFAAKYDAKLIVGVVDPNPETPCGYVFASTSPGAGDVMSNYTTTTTNAVSKANVKGKGNNATANVDTIYAFARPAPGYRFLGWTTESTRPTDVSGYKSFLMNYRTSIPGQKNGQKYNYNQSTTTYYAHFEKIEEWTIKMCVGDTVRLYYDAASYGGLKDAKYASYQATGSGNVVSAEAFVDGATNGASGKSRGCYLEITAYEAGVVTIGLQRQVEGDTAWGDYDILIDVEVSDERQLKRGASATLDCICSPISSGAATWAAPVFSTAGIVSASAYAEASAAGAKLTVTGEEAGTTTVTASNKTGDKATAFHGAEYVFAIEVLPPPTVPVVMSPGATLAVPTRLSADDPATLDRLDKTSANGVSANVDGASVMLSVATDAQVGDKARFSLISDNDIYLAYDVTVTNRFDAKVGDSFIDVTPKAQFDWTVESTDPSVAAISRSGIGSPASASSS